MEIEAPSDLNTVNILKTGKFRLVVKMYIFFAAQKDELKKYMYEDSLEKLKLDEDGKIGYTYKCMGAGFWALRQQDFRASLEAITFEVISVCLCFSFCVFIE